MQAYRIADSSNSSFSMSSTTLPQNSDKYTEISEVHVEVNDNANHAREDENYDSRIINWLSPIYHTLEKSKTNEKLKSIFIDRDGLDTLFTLFELKSNQNSNITLLLMNTVNVVCENNQYAIEQVMLTGLLEYILKLSNPEYHSKIRYEVAYFVGLIFMNFEWGIVKMFIAAGGLKTLICFIDEDYEQNHNMILITIEALHRVMRQRIPWKHNIVMIALKYNILDRLLMILDFFRTWTIHEDKDFFCSCLELITMFIDSGKPKIANIIGSHDIMKCILSYINIADQLKKSHLSKIIEIINKASTDVTKDKLEENHAIELLWKLYKFLLNFIKETISYKTKLPKNEYQQYKESLDLLLEVLKIIHKYWQMSPRRSEKVSKCHFIQLSLKSLEFSNEGFRNYIIEILIEFIMASNESRQQMWNTVDGPFVLIGILDEQDYTNNAKIFDALLSWLKWDMPRIEEFLWTSDNLLEIMKKIFKSSHKYNTQEYLHILKWLKAMIIDSERIAKFIANKKELVVKITKQLNDIKTSSIFKNEMAGYKSTESSKSGIHYYSQSSSHPGSQKTPYNIHSSHNCTQVIRDLLEIIDKLIEKSKLTPKKFIERYKLEQTLVTISHLAHANKLVILKELSMKLLSSYDDHR